MNAEATKVKPPVKAKPAAKKKYNKVQVRDLFGITQEQAGHFIGIGGSSVSGQLKKKGLKFFTKDILIRMYRTMVKENIDHKLDTAIDRLILFGIDRGFDDISEGCVVIAPVKAIAQAGSETPASQAGVTTTSPTRKNNNPNVMKLIKTLGIDKAAMELCTSVQTLQNYIANSAETSGLLEKLAELILNEQTISVKPSAGLSFSVTDSNDLVIYGNNTSITIPERYFATVRKLVA